MSNGTQGERIVKVETKLEGIIDLLREIRESQISHEEADQSRHKEALAADQKIIEMIEQKYVSKVWLQAVGFYLILNNYENTKRD